MNCLLYLFATLTSFYSLYIYKSFLKSFVLFPQVSTPLIRSISPPPNSAVRSSYAPLLQHPPEMNIRCCFPISSPNQAPSLPKGINPVNQNGYASGICYPPPLPPSYTPDFGRFPPPYQYPPRPPSVGYRNFNRRCNTDSTLDPVSFFLNLTTFCGSLDRFY
ncbi:unnamed protein product [Hymenolepis diminuta]|uniref:Uncharacterized protein n=1 Tax=Hymenolepis diminuta TaxID=6216 RepID=A0A564Z0D6_HYMDI|nr:unnamed protein product [Hymenolepis diminuta]